MLLHAPAKLNLFLHVLGRRADGYHLLESLVVFPGLSDSLRFSAAADLSLTLTGPFAADAGPPVDNLVIKAAQALQRVSNLSRGVAIHLEKQIPVGAGLGGGSADAAATLRGLNIFWKLGLDDAALYQIARGLGADVAMCLRSTPLLAGGVGDVLTPLENPLPPLYVVLAHPRIPLLTRDVYAAFSGGEAPQSWLPEPKGVTAFWQRLRATRNHLQRAAIAVNPQVAELLLALETLQPTPSLVRMTGSGACCFALYQTAAEAAQAAAMLSRDYPHWWVWAGDV